MWSGAPGHLSSDHPRIRGEHGGVAVRVPVGQGSSPHTRGARLPDLGHLRPERIIPAYAGSTGGFKRWLSRARDHPRIRGEHALRATETGPLLGSSPHTRGAPPYGFSLRRAPGIIPAYAGSTGQIEERHPEVPDHPRIRGEHALGIGDDFQVVGSSPHTRGAPDARRRCRALGRIIPAYAGSTSAWEIGGWTPTDHPRIRGEHASRSGPPHGRRGSSPHTRGAPDRAGLCETGGRIIPAYAGSTTGRRDDSRGDQDHPRIRGEHAWKSLQYQGSPP